MIRTGLYLLLTGALGAGAGVGLEQAGVLSPLGEPTVATTVVESAEIGVDLHDCPSGAPVFVVSAGDQLVATGTDASEAWVEVRSPLDGDDRLWVPAGVLTTLDGSDLAALPLRDCGSPDDVEVAIDTTTTVDDFVPDTTDPTAPTTSTTLAPRPGSTTRPPTPTTRPVVPPGPTTPTTSTSTTTTTTAPPDDPPSVSGVSATPTSLGNCSATVGVFSTLSATVTDDRPGVSVAMTYRNLTTSATGSLTNRTTVGSLHTGRYHRSTPGAVNGTNTIRLTVTATDSAGQVTSRNVQITYHQSTVC